MKNKIFLVVIIVCSLLSVNADGQSNEELTITHGPYLQNVSETKATVMFSTNKLVLPSLFLYMPDGTSRKVMNSQDGLFRVGKGIQRIDITGLKPGVKYKYYVEVREIKDYQPYKCKYGKKLRSDESYFTTFSSAKKDVNFTVFCDLHDKAEKLGKYLQNNDISKQDFYMFNGDILGHIENEEQIFSSFLDTCVSRFATKIPFFYVRGNHETRGKFARNLKNYLALENNNYYYAFSNGPVRLVVLDGGEDKPDNHEEYSGLVDFDTYRTKQLEWLKKELDSESFRNAEVKIVVIHMPIVDNAKNWYGMQQLAKNYGPVFKEAKIDLMICGHTHENGWIDADQSGFGYPIIISSNNHFIEAEVNSQQIYLVRKSIDVTIETTFKLDIHE